MAIIGFGIIAFGIAAVAFLCFVISKYHNGFWKRHGVTGPEPKVFYGNLAQMNGTLDFWKLHSWTQEFGSIYGIQEGWRNILIVSNTALLHQIFVKKFDNFNYRKHSPLLTGPEMNNNNLHVFNSYGHYWKQLRRLARPAFTINSLKAMAPILNRSLSTVIDLIGMTSSDTSPEAIDVLSYMKRMSATTLAQIALEELSQELSLSKNQHSLVFNEIFLAKCTNITEEIFYGSEEFTLRRQIRHFLNYWSQFLPPVICERLKYVYNWVKRRHDPFSVICARLRNEICSYLASMDNEFQRLKNCESEEASIGRIFLSGAVRTIGIDSIGTIMACVCHCLAANPDAQRRLQVEIDEFYRLNRLFNPGVSDDEWLSYDKVIRCKLDDDVEWHWDMLNAVAKETFRLYPIATLLVNFVIGKFNKPYFSANTRECITQTELDMGNDQTINIDVGTVIQANVLSINRNPEVYGKNANEFCPERWLQDGTNDDNNDGTTDKTYNFLSFGAGRRSCVGAKLTNFYLKLGLVKILQKYDLHLPSGVPKELEFLPGDSIMTPKSIKLMFVERNNFL